LASEILIFNPSFDGDGLRVWYHHLWDEENGREKNAYFWGAAANQQTFHLTGWGQLYNQINVT